jgi:hypothetical protein
MPATKQPTALDRPRRWTDVHGVSAHTGIAVNTLNTWRCRDPQRIPFHRVSGRCIRYDLNEVDDAIVALGQATTGTNGQAAS